MVLKRILATLIVLISIALIAFGFYLRGAAENFQSGLETTAELVAELSVNYDETKTKQELIDFFILMHESEQRALSNTYEMGGNIAEFVNSSGQLLLIFMSWYLYLLYRDREPPDTGRQKSEGGNK